MKDEGDEIDAEKIGQKSKSSILDCISEAVYEFEIRATGLILTSCSFALALERTSNHRTSTWVPHRGVV